MMIYNYFGDFNPIQSNQKSTMTVLGTNIYMKIVIENGLEIEEDLHLILKDGLLLTCIGENDLFRSLNTGIFKSTNQKLSELMQLSLLIET